MKRARENKSLRLLKVSKVSRGSEVAGATMPDHQLRNWERKNLQRATIIAARQFPRDTLWYKEHYSILKKLLLI